MPAKKKAVAKKRSAKKSKQRIDLKPVKKTLRDVAGKLRRLTRNPPDEITDQHVDAARDIATAMQDMVSGLKDAIKRAAMADGKLAPGKTITAGGRVVSLKLRAGRKPGSKNPDDYDLFTEPIH